MNGGGELQTSNFKLQGSFKFQGAELESLPHCRIVSYNLLNRPSMKGTRYE
jgi:hypothetical protein